MFFFNSFNPDTYEPKNRFTFAFSVVLTQT